MQKQWNSRTTGDKACKAPATYSMMPYTELAHGVWYPKGGMYSIVEALMNLARQAGVEFIFNAAVERIDTDPSHVRGVLLADGSHLEAEVILANVEIPYVYQKLLPKDGTVKALSCKQFSCSAISFFWGMNRAYPELGPHTLFLADDYRENFERIDQDLSLSDNPSFFQHAPARLDPSMSPHDQDNLIAIVSVVTCPPKTGPKSMLVLELSGGRNNGEEKDIFNRTDHHEIA